MNNVDTPFKSPSVLSICPGILGLERGTERAIGKIRVAAYVERESFIVANLIAGMEAGILDAAPVWTNVNTFYKVAKHFRGKVDGLIAGYPCQVYSLAGKRKGQDDERYLWSSISDIIGTVNPVWCWFENVSGHLSLGYDVVYKDLRRLGYAVEPGIFTAEEVGAPHERKRLFILAISERFIRDSRGEPSRWETGADTNRRSQRAAMGHTESYKQWNDRNESGQSEFTTGRSGNSTEKLDNAGGVGSKPQHEIPAGRDSAFAAGQTNVANATCKFNKGWWQSKQGGFTKSSDSHTESMVNSVSIERGLSDGQQGQERKTEINSTDIIGASETELGNATGRRCQQSEQERELCIPCAGCEIMAYSDDTGCGQSGGAVAVSEEFTSTQYNGSFDRWPAGPGQHQHEWEAPRTVFPVIRLPNTIRKIWRHSGKGFKKMLGKEVWKEIDDYSKASVESGMDLSTHGYNFREDLLRAAGNSVVEDTAELAFITLLNKHIKNHFK